MALTNVYMGQNVTTEVCHTRQRRKEPLYLSWIVAHYHLLPISSCRTIMLPCVQRDLGVALEPGSPLAIAVVAGRGTLWSVNKTKLFC